MSKLVHQSVRTSWQLMITAILLGALNLSAKTTSQSRTVLSADADWKFFLGDPSGVESFIFNDQSWRTVTVPHD
jgi:beta-galactosidase